MKILIKTVFTIIITISFIACNTHADIKIATNPILFDTLGVLEINTLYSELAFNENFNKASIISFYNIDQDSMQNSCPSVYCFDDKGNELYVPFYLASIPDFITHYLCRDSVKKQCRYWIEEKNGQTLLKSRTNLTDFFSENEIMLLNNQRLNETMLPKSRYYLFIEWFFFSPKKTFITLSEIDKMASLHKETVTVILCHVCRPRSEEFYENETFIEEEIE